MVRPAFISVHPCPDLCPFRPACIRRGRSVPSERRPSAFLTRRLLAEMQHEPKCAGLLRRTFSRSVHRCHSRAHRAHPLPASSARDGRGSRAPHPDPALRARVHGRPALRVGAAGVFRSLARHPDAHIRERVRDRVHQEALPVLAPPRPSRAPPRREQAQEEGRGVHVCGRLRRLWTASP